MAANVVDCDIIIAGGGATGLALALALQRLTDRCITIIDAGPAPEPVQTTDNHAPTDLRSVALSAHSCELLAHWGMGQLNTLGCAIQHIHVSDQQHIGSSVLHASDSQVAALGRVVELSALVSALQQQLQSAGQRINWFYQQSIQQIERSTDRVSVVLSSGQQINAKLLAVTEGGSSPTRQKLGIGVSDHDYQQTAIVANIALADSHNNWAFERFTPSGPLAMLPLHKPAASGAAQCSLVWTVTASQADQLLALSDADFCQALQQAFGWRLGRLVGCSQRASFALTLRQAAQHIHHRAALLGNACQTLHPIAGQGLNLALRDVAQLVALVGDSNQDPGSYGVLRRYQRNRQADQQKLIVATNTLIHSFSNRQLPLVVGRNLGLLLLDSSAFLKQQFALAAMGYQPTHTGESHAAL